MGSAFAYSVAMALLDCRSPTSGPWHCQRGPREFLWDPTHRGLGLVFVAKLLELGILFLGGQEGGVGHPLGRGVGEGAVMWVWVWVWVVGRV